MVIVVCICLAVLVVAMIACLWTASDYDREEEKEDGE